MANILFRDKADIPAHLQDKAKQVGEDDDAMWEVDTDIEDVASLRSAIDRIKSDRTSLKDKLAAYDGLDVELAKKLIEEAEKNASPEEIQARHETAIEQLKSEQAGEIETLHGEINRYLISAKAAELLSSSGGNAKLLGLHLAKRIGVEVADDGRRNVVVLGDDGKPALDKHSVPMTFDGLIKTFRDDRDYAAAFGTPGGKGDIPPKDKNKPATATELPRAEMDWDDEKLNARVASQELVLTD